MHSVVVMVRPNNRLKLAARGRPVAEWEAEHARRSLAGALGG
jgi:hypothetical protein